MLESNGTSSASIAPNEVADALIAEILGPPRPGPFGPPIHDILADRLPERASGRTLAPGPEVDAALGRLVEVLTTYFEAHPGADSTFHWEVVQRADRRIATDPELNRRAATVRRAAALAESAMEIHHASRVLAACVGPTSRSGGSSSRFRRALWPFPYLDNYEHLVGAEYRAFQRIGRADRVAFCGAGALPLTGILWHRATGNEVVLVEIDPTVGHHARLVIGRLAALGLVDKTALPVEVVGAARLDVDRFDLIVVASLVPNEVVVDLATNIATAGERRPVLMARSAVGLTRRLAYEPIDVQAIVGVGLTHVGTIASELQVTNQPSLSGLAVRSNGSLLCTAPADVLNTTEFFVARSGPSDTLGRAQRSRSAVRTGELGV